MDKKQLLILQKKGQAGLNAKMTGLIGAVIIIFLVTALAPEMFTALDGFGVETPAWVATVMTVIVGAGLVFLVWRTFN